MINDNFEKSDLHIHLDEGKASEHEKVVNLLTRAENEKVKNIGFVSFNRINAYLPGGALYELIKNEGINKYYSGKVVSAIEFVCKINNVPVSKKGVDYNKYITHILVYDFDPKLLAKSTWISHASQEERWYKDVSNLILRGKSIGLNLPELNYFDYKKGHFIDQIYEFIKSNADKDMVCKQILQNHENKSKFARHFVEEPGAPMNMSFNIYPNVTDVLRVAKQCGGKAVIAHPFNMNDKFDGFDYLDAITNINCEEKFWGVECMYMRNTTKDNNEIANYAAKKQLHLTGGSDLRYYVSDANPTGQMYYINKAGETIYYVPQPGFVMGLKEEGVQSPYIQIEKSTTEEFKPLESYYQNKTEELIKSTVPLSEGKEQE